MIVRFHWCPPHVARKTLCARSNVERGARAVGGGGGGVGCLSMVTAIECAGEHVIGGEYEAQPVISMLIDIRRQHCCRPARIVGIGIGGGGLGGRIDG